MPFEWEVDVQLFTHREDVDAVNAGELRALAGDVQKSAAKDTGSEDILRISCPVRNRSVHLCQHALNVL